MTLASFQWDAASAAAISSGSASRPARSRTSRMGHRSHIAALKPRAMSRADPAAARGVFQSLAADQPGEPQGGEHADRVRDRHEREWIASAQDREQRDEVVVEPDVAEGQAGEPGVLGWNATLDDLPDDAAVDPGVATDPQVGIQEHHRGHHRGCAGRPTPREPQSLARLRGGSAAARLAQFGQQPQCPAQRGHPERGGRQRETGAHQRPGRHRGDQRGDRQSQHPAGEGPALERQQRRQRHPGEHAQRGEEAPVPDHAGQEPAGRHAGRECRHHEGDAA